MLNGGEQWMYEGVIVIGIVINDKGWQVVKFGVVVIDIVVNIGVEGGLDVENGDIGQFVCGNVVCIIINENGCQIVVVEGIVNIIVVYVGGDQMVYGYVLDIILNGGYQYVYNGGIVFDMVVNSDGWQIIKEGGLVNFIIVNQKGKLQVNVGGIVMNVILKQGGVLVISMVVIVIGSNCLGNFVVENGKVDGVVLEFGGCLDVLESYLVQNILVDDGGILVVFVGGQVIGVIMIFGGVLIVDSGVIVEGINVSGKFSIDGIFGQVSGLLLENGGSFMVNVGGQVSNIIVGYCGILMLVVGGSLSGRIQFSKGVSMVLNGDVVSIGDIVNVGEICFDNQMIQDVVLSCVVVKSNFLVMFYKLIIMNFIGQGGIINMCVSFDGSNVFDQLVINGGQVIGKIWFVFINVGNSNFGVVIFGQGIWVVDVQNGVIIEEGVFVLSCLFQVGVFNYILNCDSDEDWYLCSENVYCVEVFLYIFMLIQVMDYDWILVGFCSYQIGVNGENNSVCFSIQGGYFGYDNNGGIVCGVMLESSGSYGFVCLEGDLFRIEVVGMFVIVGVYGVVGYFFVDVKDDDGFCVGMVWDDVGSLGGYLNLIYMFFGLWVDIVVQGICYSMKVLLDNNDFCVWGWGWLGLLEIGLFFSIIDNLMLEL